MMKRQAYGVGLSLLAVAFMVCRCGTAGQENRLRREIGAYFPDTIDSWKLESLSVSGASHLQSTDEPYREVLLRSSFIALAVGDYTEASGGRVRIRLYGMGSSPDAWGVFSLKRSEGRPVPLGQQAVYGESSLLFWKGRYCVELSAQDGSVSKDALFNVARVIEARIHEVGDKPFLLNKIPPGFPESLVVYFHAGKRIGSLPDALSMPGGVLDVSEKTNVLELTLSEGATIAFIQYASQSDSKKAFERISSAFKAAGALEQSEKGAVQAWEPEPQKYLVGSLKGPFLVLSYGMGPTAEEALSKAKIFLGRL
jgi:hypothetical protein